MNIGAINITLVYDKSISYMGLIYVNILYGPYICQYLIWALYTSISYMGLIYVNILYGPYILSFADDTTLYTSHSNLDELYANANEKTNDLYQWFSNRLSLNAKKKTSTLY